MSSDLTFITNEGNKNLKERFEVLIKDTRFFDVLVGYFYTSGFYSLYKSLESTEKVRILIGISTDKKIFDMMNTIEQINQGYIEFSHSEVKKNFEKNVQNELENL